jgi:hypothetical protein
LAGIQGIRQRKLDVGFAALNFLAVVGLLAGCSLIWAAFLGDPDQLPSAWREYVAVAGVVGIGLALQHLMRASRRIWSAPSGDAVADRSGGAPVAGSQPQGESTDNKPG